MKKFLATILSVVLLLTIIPMAYAEENNTYKVGDIIQFGSYPQSEVKDEALIAELNALAPEWDEWTSYGYYSGNGEAGSMVQGDWMRYTDITYNGSKYRGVKFTQYRPSNTCTKVTSEFNTTQYENGYFTNNIYWFNFDNLSWRILDPNEGLVVCETIIDAQSYNNTVYHNVDIDIEVSIINSKYAFFNDYNYTVYACDYETSSIRKWLNEDFYNYCFNDSEKREIKNSVLNNDGYYTSIGNNEHTALDSKETCDNIFLLSYKDVKNSDYGFSSNNVDIENRTTNGSDYAKCQGLFEDKSTINGEYSNRSSWILRSPGYHSFTCCGVTDLGYTESFGVVIDTMGIRPALRVKDISKMELVHIHNYSETAFAPTCTTQGYTTYTCVCGDSYVADYVNALGHKDANGDYKCDNNCGYEYEKPAPENPDTPEEPSKDCSCNCHKSGFMGFIWKIINFFNKLFKSNQTCACGAKHW